MMLFLAMVWIGSYGTVVSSRQGSARKGWAVFGVADEDWRGLLCEVRTEQVSNGRAVEER